MLTERLCEHQLLIRHLAALQTRCTDTVNGLQRSVQALQAEREALHVRLWSQQVRLVLQTTLLSWVGGAAVEGLAGQVPSRTPAQTAVQAMTPQHAALLVHRVICQTGCLSHGDHWREGGHCRRTGLACDAPPVQELAESLDAAGQSPGKAPTGRAAASP